METQTTERRVIGTCPHCGGDIIVGKYGPYCVERCGMMLGKMFGRQLQEKELQDILNGQEVLLEDLVSKRSGNTYSMYVKMRDVEPFMMTDKNTGNQVTRYQIGVETRFPERNSSEST